VRVDRGVALAWGFVLLWMLLIFALSAQSGLGGQEWPPPLQAVRKLGHVAEYSVLAVLVGRALLATWRRRGGGSTLLQSKRILLARAWLVGVALTTLYAITDEAHQGLVPQRGPHIEDVLIDALSATAALGIWYIVLAREA
jgi:VanZ family protein